MRSPDTPPTDAAHGRGYETRDVNLRAILWLAAVVVVLVVVSMIGLDMLWNAYIAQAKEADPVLSPLADLDQTPPLPRLQSSPNVELTEFRAQQEEKVTTYGWVDREKKLVRIPIARAIDLALKNGLPKPAPQPQAGETPAEETSTEKSPAQDTSAPAETPAAETPAAEVPATETPAAESPAPETDPVPQPEER